MYMYIIEIEIQQNNIRALPLPIAIATTEGIYIYRDSQNKIIIPALALPFSVPFLSVTQLNIKERKNLTLVPYIITLFYSTYLHNPIQR